MNACKKLLQSSAMVLALISPATAASWEADLLFGKPAVTAVAPAALETGVQAGGTSGLGAALSVTEIRQHNYRSSYLAAGKRADLYAKQGIAERIGEEGASVYARSKAYQPVLENGKKVLRTGADKVFVDPKTSDVVVIEAKGGTSPLGRGYGYPQGSPEWAVEQAKHVFRSSKASLAERQAARVTLEAAAKNKLRVEVVRTRHMQGTPRAPFLENATPMNQRASQMARESLNNTRKDLPGPYRKPLWSPGIKRVATNTVIATGVVTAVSGTINGYRYAKGRIPGEEAAFRTAADGGLGGTSYLAAQGVLQLVGKNAHLAVRIGSGVTVARFVFESGRDIVDVVRGDASPGELKGQIGENAVKALMTGAGATVILLGFSNPGTATILIVAVGAAITADIAYDAIAPAFRKHSTALQAYYERLPSRLKKRCPLEWIGETKDLEHFGVLYGPRQGKPESQGHQRVRPANDVVSIRQQVFNSRMLPDTNAIK